MSLEELKNMSDEELNIQVSKLHWIPKSECNRVGGCLKEIGLRSGLEWGCKCDNDKPIPPYSTDLNVMREAEEYLFELPDGVTQKYIEFLSEFRSGWERDIDRCTFANCRDRAISFIGAMEWHKKRMSEQPRYVKGPAPNPYVWG